MSPSRHRSRFLFNGDGAARQIECDRKCVEHRLDEQDEPGQAIVISLENPDVPADNGICHCQPPASTEFLHFGRQERVDGNRGSVRNEGTATADRPDGAERDQPGAYCGKTEHVHPDDRPLRQRCSARTTPGPTLATTKDGGEEGRAYRLQMRKRGKRDRVSRSLGR